MGRHLGTEIFYDETAENQGSQRLTAHPVDLSVLESLFDGDMDTATDVLGTFIRQIKQDIETLENTLPDGYCEDWPELAHKLKGSAAFIGAENMRYHCAQAQEMVTASSSCRKKICKDIKAEFSQIEYYFQNYCH